MEIEKSIFFMLDSISRHNSKTLHVFRIFDFDLEPAQIFENVPSPVLAKSPTGIGQFANRYWPIRQPVLANSPTGIDEIPSQLHLNLLHQNKNLWGSATLLSQATPRLPHGRASRTKRGAKWKLLCVWRAWGAK